MITNSQSVHLLETAFLHCFNLCRHIFHPTHYTIITNLQLRTQCIGNNCFGNLPWSISVLESHRLTSKSFSSVQLLSHVWLSVTPWTAARQASLSITSSQSSPKPMSMESVMSSNHLILCHPLFLPLSIFPSIQVFSNESVLHIRWPQYWSFSFSISPSKEYSGLISFRIDQFDLLAVQGTLKSLL